MFVINPTIQKTHENKMSNFEIFQDHPLAKHTLGRIFAIVQLPIYLLTSLFLMLKSVGKCCFMPIVNKAKLSPEWDFPGVKNDFLLAKDSFKKAFYDLIFAPKKTISFSMLPFYYFPRYIIGRAIDNQPGIRRHFSKEKNTYIETSLSQILRKASFSSRIFNNLKKIIATSVTFEKIPNSTEDCF